MLQLIDSLMKKTTLLTAVCVMVIHSVFAGGILTNSNQSAQYIRMLSRNASTDIDAVYFNPAGLIQMKDGWHFAFSSQTIFQDKTVDSKFPLLNDGYYKGTVTVPVFPTAFAVYKKENWAFSLGFGPNSGGGAATFDRGLPSFEIPISKVVPGLAGLSQVDPALAVSGYSADLSFEGTSVFWGIQLGATYKVNDVFSVYGGLRYLPSTNTYKGSIENIQLQVGSTNPSMTPAPAFLTQASGIAGAKSTQLSGFSQNYLAPLISAGGGGYTLDQLQQAGYIDATQKAQLAGGLLQIGYTQEQIDVITVSDANSGVNATADQLSATANTLSATADKLGDKQVDTEQTGTGFTPMIGVNISPNEKFNFALRYEMKTALKLTNKTKVDDVGMFPDGGTSNSDIPAVLAVGVGYDSGKLLEGQLSYTLYFDKGVDWGNNVRDLAIWKDVDPTQIRKRTIDKNYFELALGLQFNLSDKFAFSIGGMRSAAGIADDYESDFSFANPSYTGAFGFMWKMTDRLTLDAGFSNTFYQDKEVTFTDPDVPDYKEIYGKTTTNYAIGLSYSIF